jgi:hypothetical protein
MVPTVQKAGLAPGLVWMDVENLASTGIRSPDRPVRSKSLHQLQYPNPTGMMLKNVPILVLSNC